MKRTMARLAWVGVAVTFWGCGKSTNEPQVSTQRLNGVEYLFVEKGSLTATDTSLAGTGSLVFRAPLIDEDNNYAVTFSIEDGGSLTLAALSDRSLQNGVSMEFSRTGARLKVKISAKGQNDDVSVDFAGVAADKAISLAIDVHGHGDILVDGVGDTLGYSIPKGPYGNLWGLSLNKATVTQAVAARPKHPH